jgi:hypothetical protein
MASLTLLPLSASLNGIPIQISTTSTALHTADPTKRDIVSLWVSNSSASAVTLTLELGSTTASLSSPMSIPGNSGLVLVVDELGFSGGVALTAKAGTATVLSIVGRVKRVG